MSRPKLSNLEVPSSTAPPAEWVEWMRRALSDLPRRWSHVSAVWRRASALAPAADAAWGDGTGRTIELSALLHDVGRAIDPADAQPHGLIGAAFLRDAGFDGVAALVAQHSGGATEARIRGFAQEMDRWPVQDHRLLALLTFIDSTTSPDGLVVSPRERYTDIAARYGDDSFQIRAFDSIWDEIEEGRQLAEDLE